MGRPRDLRYYLRMLYWGARIIYWDIFPSEEEQLNHKADNYEE